MLLSTAFCAILVSTLMVGFEVSAVPTRISGEVIKIMPMGDSLTSGWDPTNPTYFVGYRQRLYLGLKQAGFNVDFVGSLSNGGTAVPPFDLDHEGHNGYRADQVATDVYGWLVGNPADIVLLHIGTNDISGGNEDVAEVEDILDEVDRYESDYSKNVTVMLALIILRKDTKNPETIAFNDAVENMARLRIVNGDDIVIVDQERALDYPVDLLDYAHPTPEGYEKMGDTWYDAVVKTLAYVHHVVRGLDNGLYYRSYNGSWGSWAALPGSTADSPAVATLTRLTPITYTAADWSNGYEEGDFSEWSQITEDSGCDASVLAVDPREGTYHASFSTIDDGSAYVKKSFEGSLSWGYARAYVKPKDQNGGAFAWVLAFGKNDMGIAAARWDTSGYWNLVYRDAGAWYSVASSVRITNGLWYYLELYHKSGSGTGEDKLWINGELEVSQTGLDNDDRGHPEYLTAGKVIGTDDGDPVVYIDSVSVYGETFTITTFHTPTLHAVVRGADGSSLYHGYVNLTDDTFSGWTWLPGSTPSPPTLVSDGTTLYLVVRGEDDQIYYNVWNGGWGSWTLIPGSTTAGPAAAVVGGALHIVVQGYGATSLYHCYVNLTDDTFSGWTGISGATPVAPTLAASEKRNVLFLVVKGMDNMIYYEAWNGVEWEGWAALPSGATCATPGATVQGDTLQIVVRSEIGTELWHSYISLQASAFSGWNGISGSTESGPRLAT